MPEFRKDPIVDRWVIIAGERAERPQAKPQRAPTTDTDVCPFCAGNERMTPPPVLVLSGDDALGPDAGWSVRVVPNKYPALAEYGDSIRPQDDLYHCMNATGAHEVVVETPKHITDLAALGELDIERILQAYRERMLHLRTDTRWQYILIYKNEGTEAGATLSHSHSQIAALPNMPKEPLAEFEAAKKHYTSASRCIYCKLIQTERENSARIVSENEQFIVFCPFASRMAGETWILPKRHVSSFDAGPKADLRALAHTLQDLMGRLAVCFHEPAFNYFIRSNPLQEPENPHYHWHLEILPKLQYIAGFEWGSGLYINSLPPEQAARLLRDAVI